MTVDQTTTAYPAPPLARQPGSRWTGGRVVGVVFSSLAAVVGIVLMIGGLGAGGKALASIIEVRLQKR